MPELTAWKCSGCGANVDEAPVAQAGVHHCRFCGAVVVATQKVAAHYAVRVDSVPSNAIALVLPMIVKELHARVDMKALLKDGAVVWEGQDAKRADEILQRLLGAGARATVISVGGPAAPVHAKKIPDPLVIGCGRLFESRVEIRRSTDDAVLAAADAEGKVELSVPTGGAPLDACVVIDVEGVITRIRFNHPLRASRALQDPISTLLGAYPPKLQLYEMMAVKAGTQRVKGKGMISLRALDGESGAEVAGVRFTVDRASTRIVYTNDDYRVAMDRDTTGSGGWACIFNAEPGDIELGAEDWPTVRARVHADEILDVTFWK